MAETTGTPLDKTPGLAAPPGQSSNFEIHNQLDDILIGTVTVCLILTTSFMIARLILRARVNKAMKPEDCE